MYLHFVLEGRG